MAHEIYLKLEGDVNIEGEATSKAYKKHIVLNDFGYSIEAASPDGRGSGGPTLTHLQINKHLDKASPKFALAAFNRAKFTKATIYLCKVSATASKDTVSVLKCTFENLTCLGYDFTGQDHSTENINFKYDIVEAQYIPLDASDFTRKGQILSKLDRKKNEGG